MPLLYSDLARSFGQIGHKTISLPKDIETLEREMEEQETFIVAGDSTEASAQEKREAQMLEKLKRDVVPQLREELQQELEKEKNRILQAAENQAEELRQTAQQEGYESGYAAGMQQGLGEGREKAFVEAQEECDSLRNAAELVKRKAKAVLEAAHEKALGRADRKREEIIDLSIAIAEKIINAELSTSRELIPGIAEEACREFKKRKNIILNVYPDNVELFEASVSAFSKICPNAEFVILPDESIEENGCIIESDTTVLDAQVTTRLENIKRALKEIAGDDDE